MPDKVLAMNDLSYNLIVHDNQSILAIIQHPYFKHSALKTLILTCILRNRSDEYKTDLMMSFAERLIPCFVSAELDPIIYQMINLSDSKKRSKNDSLKSEYW